MDIEVVSLGVVKSEAAPDIHYPPGRYTVPDEVAAALREQGVLAEEAAPVAGVTAPPPDDAPSAPGRKGKGA